MSKNGERCRTHRTLFTGTRVLNADHSQIGMPMPGRWTQDIVASDTEMSVREEIVAADGSALHVTIDARFDGADYAVTGSPMIDAVAYRRIDRRTIMGTGKRHGTPVVSMTLTASPDDRIVTVTYVLAGSMETPWRAVFDTLEPR